MERAAVEQTVKSYLCQKYVAGDCDQQLSDSTPLTTGGILDSLSTLELVAYLEKTYGIEVEAHEVGVHHLNTIADIAEFVCTKTS